MPSKSDCRRFNAQAQRHNPDRVGLAKKYFKSGCSDPVTALSYWRRRFPNPEDYFRKHWYPRKFGKLVPKGYLQTKQFKSYVQRPY